MSLTETMTAPGGTAVRGTLRALDDYPLAACRYPADPDATFGGEPRGRIVVAGATGVPQGFYRRFALHAASRGFTTVTFDYRGIGGSKPPTLRGFEATFLDWAELDLAGVIRSLTCEGDTPLYLVGHSFGGHALGLLPDPSGIARAYLFGNGAGWYGWMPRLEQLRVRALWALSGPLVTRWKGYLAWSTIGMGEDLPLGVYRQWRRWCSHPRYFFDDPTVGQAFAERFARVTAPIVAYTALDDRWATPASRDALMVGYRSAPLRVRDVAPAELGGPIGHMGYFRPTARPLWSEVLDDLTVPPSA